MSLYNSENKNEISTFAKALGSVDFHTRERGLQALTLYLKAKHEMELIDMSKLWKGLFYAFWSSDKQPVQDELAARLAAIFPNLSERVAELYFKVFLETMAREWFGIDRLRLDKFLRLIRIFVRQLFVYLHSTDWSEAVVARYFGHIETLLKNSDEQITAGLSFQIADVAVPELLSYLREQNQSIPDRPFRQLLEVFLSVMVGTTRKTLVHRIRSGTFEPLLEELSTTESFKVLDQLDVASLAKEIFDRGAAPGIKADTRAQLYDLSTQLESATRKRKRPPALPQPSSGGKEAVPDAARPQKVRKKLREKVLAKQDAAHISSLALAETSKPKEKNTATISSSDALQSNGVTTKPTAELSKRKGKAGIPLRKHVTFALKRNLYFAEGQPRPNASLRVPESCRPKGSALKATPRLLKANKELLQRRKKPKKKLRQSA